jgi:hypothetical protein
MFLDRLPASTVIRLLGAVMLGGAIYALCQGHFLGWFWLPSILLALIAGPGLLAVQDWARVPATLFYAHWLIFGLVVLFRRGPSRGIIALIAAALCCLPVLWRWGQNRVEIYSSSDLTRRSSLYLL